MRRTMQILGVGALLVSLALSACGGGNAELPGAEQNPTEMAAQATGEVSDLAQETTQAATGAGGSQCSTDAECVPDACCHAKGCVPKAEGPQNCADMVCSMECAPGTMDCGAGACACLNGTCGVKWRDGAAGGPELAE